MCATGSLTKSSNRMGLQRVNFFKFDLDEKIEHFNWIESEYSIGITFGGIKCRYITSDCDAVATVDEYQNYTKTPEDAVADVLKAGLL